MTLCSVLIVDRKPLRSAALRAHLARYALNSALACEHPSAATAATWSPPVLRGTASPSYALWLVVLGRDSVSADWQAVSKAADSYWVALRVPGSKLSDADLLAAQFDQIYTLPLSPAQLDELLLRHGAQLKPQDPTAEPLPVLDDVSARAAAMGDEGLVSELRTMLRDDLKQRIPQVADELARYEIASAAETVHRLVGGCGYCGAKALQQASLDLENALHARDVDAVDQVYGRWLNNAETLLAALAEHH